MISGFSLRDITSIALIALTTVVGLVLWPALPEWMAIYFPASGAPDTSVPKAIAVFAMPVVMVLTHLIMVLAARLDPPNDERVMSVTMVATMGLLASLQFLVFAWHLGYAVPFDLVTVGAIIWGVLLCGYAFIRERGSSIG